MLAAENYTQIALDGNKNFRSICSQILLMVTAMRRNLLIICSLIFLMNPIAGVVLGLDTNPLPPDRGECLVYIGTRATPKGKGIYMCRLNNATGTLTSLGIAAETTDPAFLAIHPNHRFLYAVRENGGFDATPNGAVSAFAIDKATGTLA